MVSFTFSCSLSTLILLSTLIGYFGPSDADVMRRMPRGNHQHPYPVFNAEDRDGDYLATNSDLVEPALKIQQQREEYWKGLEPLHGVNETLWAAVVDAALRTPFDWMKLSKALDTVEEDFQRLSPVATRNSQEPDEELQRSEKSSRGSKWKFTYHRVLTFLRNSSGPGQSRRLSAIAAMSASEIRPSPPSALHHPSTSSSMPSSSSPSLITTNPLLLFHSHPTTTTGDALVTTVRRKTSGQEAFTLDEEILSRLFLEEENNEGEDDYQIHEGRDRVSSSSSSKRHFHQQSSRKLSDHSEKTKMHPWRNVYQTHHHDHQKNHDDNPFSYHPPNNGYSHHQKRHDPMK